MDVLIVSPVNPQQRDGGFKIAIASDVAALRAAGARVAMVCSVVGTPEPTCPQPGLCIEQVPVKQGGRVRRSIRSLASGIPAAVERYYTREMAAKLREQAAARRYDLVVVQDVSLGRWIPLLRKALPKATLVLRSHNDMTTVSAAQTGAAPALLRPLYREEQRRWARLERDALEQADAIWAITEDEAAAFKQRHRGRQVGCLPIAVDVERYAAVGTCGNAPDRFGHLGTLDWKKSPGMTRFLRDIWPDIRRHRPRAELVLGGRVTAARRLAGQGVSVLGYVPDDRAFLSDIDIFVNPQTIGAGIKLKSLVSLAAGRVLLSTAIGVQGMRVRHGTHYLDLDLLHRRRQVDRLWCDAAQSRHIAECGRAWVREHHCEAAVARRLQTLL
jgi:hypothetical protein